MLLTSLLGCEAQESPAGGPAEKATATEKATAVSDLPGIPVAAGVFQIGRLEPARLTESSGVVASRQFPGVFWTHNDGGGPKRQILYAVTRTGRARAEFRLSEVFLDDWEDIAIDDSKRLYIADIGNNDAKRDELAVYRIDEPDPALTGASLPIRQSWRLRFPGARFDAESLFVWKEFGYIVSKVFKNARAEIYRFPLEANPNANTPLTLEFVAQTKIESPVTGADISPDGRLLALVAKSGAFVIPVGGDISRAHKEKGYQARFRHESIEGCCFVPEGLLCTAETREIYLFTDPPFRGD